MSELKTGSASVGANRQPGIATSLAAALGGGVSAVIVAPIAFLPVLLFVQRPPVAQTLEGIARSLLFVGLVACVLGLVSSMALAFPAMLLMRRYRLLHRGPTLALGAVTGLIAGAGFAYSAPIAYGWSLFGAAVGTLCSAIAVRLMNAVRS